MMTPEGNKPEWLAQVAGVLEVLNEGVLIVDDCDDILFANECLARMCGWPAAQLLGRSRNMLYQGNDLRYLEEQLARSRDAGHSRFEFYLPRNGGERLPVIVSARIVEDLEGREFTVITFSDIREQKEAQEQLRQANHRLQQRQEEIDRELELAARVQQSLAPKSLVWGPFAVETFYLPVRTIGGDFGLVTPLSDDELNLLVCDVSGHGIGSALVANRIYSELVALLERRADLEEMLLRLNEFVIRHLRLSGFYFSLAAARLRHPGGRLSFASAGHPPALWATPQGEVRRLETRSTVLGLLPKAVAPQPAQQIQLGRGDRLVLYTDGVTEVFNDREEIFGIEGLEEVVRQTVRWPLAGMKQAILDRMAAWRHGPDTDDVSLVLVELR